MAGRVTAIGLGNIGSPLVEHIARIPGVSRITLVDPGRYEWKDLRGQRIDRSDLDRPKVDAQADRIRRIDPALEVVAIPERVEAVPLGRLRSDVIVTGLDNWRARLFVNEAARRLGTPWIDAAVQAEGMLVRVNVYSPGEDNPCLECGWGERDYHVLEQVRPCAPDLEVASTSAPASLGALAAALESIECEKVLRSEQSVLEGRQVLLDARHHTYFVSSLRRNPACRLADHGSWRVEPTELGSGETTIEALVATLAPGASSLEVFGGRFVRSLVCPDCAQRVPVLRVASRRAAEQSCPRCGQELVPNGFHTYDVLDLSSLSDSEKELTVGDLGLHDGDIVGLGCASGVIRRCEVSLAARPFVHRE